MNVVVIDSGRLAGDADFPPLDLDKFGWQQYPEVPVEEVAERCWRADIIVTVATPIDRKVIDNAFKLKLITVAADRTDLVDLEAARERGITVCTVSGHDPADPTAAEAICGQVVARINAYVRGEPLDTL